MISLPFPETGNVLDRFKSYHLKPKLLLSRGTSETSFINNIISNLLGQVTLYLKSILNFVVKYSVQ